MKNRKTVFPGHREGITSLYFFKLTRTPLRDFWSRDCGIKIPQHFFCPAQIWISVIS